LILHIQLDFYIDSIAMASGQGNLNIEPRQKLAQFPELRHESCQQSMNSRRVFRRPRERRDSVQVLIVEDLGRIQEGVLARFHALADRRHRQDVRHGDDGMGDGRSFLIPSEPAAEQKLRIATCIVTT
jgi:hypothetical protein